MRKITLLLLFMTTIWSFAQVKSYTFTPSSGTYSELTDATRVILGNSSNDYHNFCTPGTSPLTGTTSKTGIGLPIGFTFKFNGFDYDKFGVNTNGWIGLGTSVGNLGVNLESLSVNNGLTSTTVVTPEALSARIAVLSRDLAAQSTPAASELSYKTINGTDGLVLVIQWKNYKRFGTAGNGDNFNFQIRLYENTNKVEFVYGSIVTNSLTPLSEAYQVGLRGYPSTDLVNFSNVTSTTTWSNPGAGTAAADTMTMNGTVFPASGTTFTWTPNVCGDANAMVVNSLTTSSANLSWGSYIPNTDGYRYKVVKAIQATDTPATYMPNSSDLGTFTSVGSVSLSELSDNSLYYVYTRSKCGDNYNSWSSLGAFRTRCIPIASYWENFDSFIYDSSKKVVPPCWDNFGTTGDCYLNGGAIGPGSISAPNSIWINLVSASPAKLAYLHLPETTTLQANYRLRFKAYGNASSGVNKTVELGYLTDPTNVSTFHNIGSVNVVGTTPATAQWYVINPTEQIPANVGIVRLVMKFTGSNSPLAATMAIDDVVWEPKPSCGELSGITYKNVRSNSVDLSWVTSGTETTWQYAYTPLSVKTSLGLEPMGDADKKQDFTISGLTPGASYNIWLRSKCGTDVGSWYGVANITTACAAVNKLYETFDASLNVPDCWRKVGSSGASVAVVSANGTAGSNTLELKNESSSVAVVLALPPFFNATGMARIRFNAKSPHTGGVLTIGYVSDLTDTSTYGTELKSFSIPTTANTVVTVSEPLGAIDGSKYLVLKYINSAGVKTLYIDDFSLEIDPGCNDVKEVTSKSIIGDSMKMKWLPGVNESQWEYVVGTPTDRSPVNLEVKSFINPSEEGNYKVGNVIGLSPTTSYKVWMRPSCSITSKGVWVGPIYFTTTCAAEPSFNQNFDSALTMPDCWKKVGTPGAASINALTTPIATNVLKIDGNTNSPTVVAIRPVTNAGAGTHLLRFKLSGSVANEKIEVGYLTDLTDPASFKSMSPPLIYSVDSATQFTDKSAILGTNPTSQILAFRNPGTSAVTRFVYIDNVIWEPLPTCVDIGDFKASELTDNTIKLTWTKLGEEASWDYALGSATATDTNGLTPIPFILPEVNESTITGIISGLTPSNGYKVWVRPNCGDGINSTWMGPVSFTTTCTFKSSFDQNFDLATIMPDCWRILKTSGTAEVVAGVGLNASSALKMGNDSSSGGITMVVISPVNNAASGTHRLRFKMKTTKVGRNIQVGYMTNLLDMSTFTMVETLTAGLEAYETKIVTFPEEITSPFLVFRCLGQTLTDAFVYIDDVHWESIPSCLEVKELSVSKISGNKITANWTKGSGETSWQYVIGTAVDFDPDATNLTVKNIENPTVNGTDVSALIPGLAPTTDYKLWIRSKCSDSSVSLWSNATAFTTICAAQSTFQQNFDLVVIDPKIDLFPVCWSKVGVGVAKVTTGAGASLPNVLYMSSTGPSVESIIVMPPVTNASAGTHRLKFRMKGGNGDANGAIDIGYLNDSRAFVWLKSVSAGSGLEFVDKSVDLGTGFTADQFAFRKVGDPSGYVYIDDVVWEPKPSCPDQSNLIVKSVSSASVRLGWKRLGTESQWQYSFAPATETDPANGTIVDFVSPDVTDNNIVGSVIGLNASTAYKIWVRSKCGEGLLGYWSAPVAFNTICSPVSAFPMQKFDESLISVPECWKKINGVDIASKNAADMVGASSPNVLRLISTSNLNPAVAIIPPVNNAPSGTNILKFKVKASKPNNSLDIVYMTGPSSFTVLTSLTGLSDTDFEVVSLDLGTGFSAEEIAFVNPGLYSAEIYIDDVSWEIKPTCAEVTNVNVKLPTSTSVQASWDVIGMASKWQYVVAPADVADPNTLPLTLIKDADVKSLTIGDLLPNTSYKLWVRTNCGDSFFGNWNSTTVFKTPCETVNTIIENFEAGLTLPDCWNKVGVNGSVTVVAGKGTGGSNGLELKTEIRNIPVLAALPPLSTATTGGYRLKFKYKALLGGTHFQIGYFNDPLNSNGDGSFIILKDITIPEAGTEYGFNEVLATASTPYLGLKIWSVSVITTVWIDDFSWELPKPTTCVTDITASPDTCGNYPTQISWVADPEAAGYKLTVGTTSGGSEILNNQNLGNVLKYSFAGNLGTVYYFTLKPFNVLGEAVGCPEQTFTTGGHSCLDVDMFESNNFRFYPNPVMNVLNISLDKEITEVLVMNIIGQQVMSESVYATQVKVDMSSLSRGTYLVKVISGDQSKLIKVIRE